MLRLFRGFTATWPARIFFTVLASAFALWGVSTKNPFGADPTTIATVGGRAVNVAEVQDAYTRQIAQVRRKLGPDTEPNDALRHDVAEQALGQVVTQAAVDGELRRLGVVASDAAVRDAVFAEPHFHGPNGQFDHATMEAVLRQNQLNEARYVDLTRQSVAHNQLNGAVRAGVAAPAVLVAHLYAIAHETRLADAVDVRLSQMPTPAAPSDADLRRWVDNHPERYQTPEYRHMKAIVLTPDEIAKTVQITDPEIATAYEQRAASFTGPERRTVDVVTAPDEARARDLSAQWRSGADWAQMQTAATAAGATATELPDTSRADLPFPELADSAFTLPEHTVSDPIKGALGYYVASVSKVTPAGTRPLTEVHDELRATLARERANDLLYDREREVEDLLAGGTPFEKLWSELGLLPTSGTLDAAGKTQAGVDAPIPLPDAMRAPLVQAVFAAKKDDAPKLVPVPYPGAPAGTTPQGYFAVVVDEVTPPASRPFEQVADAARADYARDQTHRAADALAAGLLAAVQSGQTLEAAALAAKVELRHLPPVGRGRAPAGVPEALVKPLFLLKPGQPTMVETPDGFTVAQLTKVVSPEPTGDPAGAERARTALTREVAADTELAFATAAREAASPTVNQRLLDSIARSTGNP